MPKLIPAATLCLTLIPWASPSVGSETGHAHWSYAGTEGPVDQLMTVMQGPNNRPVQSVNARVIVR